MTDNGVNVGPGSIHRVAWRRRQYYRRAEARMFPPLQAPSLRR